MSNKFVALGASKETIGFSNSRLAYDEIISKFCFSVETGTLKKKITSNDISIQYRQAIPFSDECIRIVAKTLEKFMECIIGWDDFKYSFNKATACRDILYQNIHFLFVLCSLSRQLSGSVSDQGRYASSNSGWFR